ncbi:MAG: DNA topology modulation protein [Clostridia bacterium]|nr:DNA topology modulation protein [Clostridia bacterium]
MKIAVIGYSGSGKSTLARRLGIYYDAPVLHLDSVHFLPDWKVRDRQEKEKIVEDFLNGSRLWVVDGNYPKLSYDRRMAEADLIVMMLFNRFNCLWRVTKRYRKFKNSTRPDMAKGCSEKLDFEFVRWVLYKGRSKADTQRFKNIKNTYSKKTVVLKNQKQLDRFLKQFEGENNEV